MRIGINGFGRIGRNFLKVTLGRFDELEVVAINDLQGARSCAHLFKYDSTYGVYDGPIQAQADRLTLGGREITVFAERDPARIRWDQVGADLIIESTGLFTDAAVAAQHLAGGRAKKVIISAPAKNEDKTLVMGVNDDTYDPDKHHILSLASCTTNCLAAALCPVVSHFGWQRGFMSTIHAYTNDQQVLDAPHKDLRRARSAATNIIPTTSGAAKALYLAVPELKNTFDGFALRVPTATVSMCHVVFNTKREMTRDALNQVLADAAGAGRLHGILGYNELELVSSDYRRSPLSGSVDGLLTQAQANLGQIAVWYDNEWGYASRLADLAKKVASMGPGRSAEASRA